MTITFTLPLVGNKPSTSKDLVLTILAERHPLSLIELQNAMHKQHGKSVSFQSVRQAVLELEGAKVLTRDGKKFSLSRSWIQELILFGNKLQRQYLTPSAQDKLAVGPNVTVYTLNTLAETDGVWNAAIREIFSDAKHAKVQTFTSMHFWFVLVVLAQETALITDLTKKGIQSNFICYGQTPLDKWTVKYYQDLGIGCKSLPRPPDFPLGLNIGSYGDTIIQVEYPQEVQEKLDGFYGRYQRIEDARLAEIAELSTMPGEYRLTIIRDAVLAKNFRESVLKEF